MLNSRNLSLTLAALAALGLSTARPAQAQKLLVSSGTNILAYNLDGTSAGTYATLGGDTVSGIVYSGGSLYAVDQTNRTLQKYNGTSFSLFSSFGSVGSGVAQQLTVDPSGNFYVATQSVSQDSTPNTGGVVKIDGTTGAASQLFLDNYNVLAVTSTGGTGLAFGDTGGNTGFFELGTTDGTRPAGAQIGFSSGGYTNISGLTTSSSGNVYGTIYADGDGAIPGVYKLNTSNNNITLVGTGTGKHTVGGDLFVGNDLFVADANAGTILQFANLESATSTVAGTQFASGIIGANYLALTDASPAPEASQTLAMGVMVLGLGGLMLRARKRQGSAV